MNSKRCCKEKIESEAFVVDYEDVGLKIYLKKLSSKQFNCVIARKQNKQLCQTTL